MLLHHEGGFVNHPKDPGGMTNLGVTKAVYDKWIGREAVVNWLVSNQVIFEIISHEFLEEELEAIGDLDHESKTNPDQVLMN